METDFTRLLSGKDLRRLENSRKVIDAVTDQETFDKLFGLIFHHERPLVMRAADAVEKITIRHKNYLGPHKGQLLAILNSADHKELKWHIAQLLPRMALNKEELTDVWHKLTYWALNMHEGKIVRVNALQGLFDLSTTHPELRESFKQTLEALEHEPVPSLQARIRKLRNVSSDHRADRVS